jgi:hypothetical protein
MNSKLAVLMLTAAAGSTALVASAQQPTYSLGTANGPRPAAAPVPQPNSVPAIPPPPATPGGTSPFYTSRPGVWTINGEGFSAEDAAVGRHAHQLAQAFAREKSDSDREKIKGQLGDLLKEQFDKRQKRHEDEIKQLEAQIKKLRDLVDKRQENRREIISRRLDQIVRESQGLGW